jgi:hypothetical protein
MAFDITHDAAVGGGKDRLEAAAVSTDFGLVSVKDGNIAARVHCNPPPEIELTHAR